MKNLHLTALAALVVSSYAHASFDFDIPDRQAVESKPVAATAAPVQVKALPASTNSTRYVVKAHTADKNDNCLPKSIAMTFTNLPTQKGPHLNRWVSLGCAADQVSFVKEGDESYNMQWDLSYDKELGVYRLNWTYKVPAVGKDVVEYGAHHTFDLNVPRTLSLTNGMAVTLRKVTP